MLVASAPVVHDPSPLLRSQRAFAQPTKSGKKSTPGWLGHTRNSTVQQITDISPMSAFSERLAGVSLKNTLKNLLSTKEGLIAFRAYLASTFCSQHLDFYLVCDELLQNAVSLDEKVSPGTDYLRAQAVAIYSSFVRPGATDEVNLPSTLVLQLATCALDTSASTIAVKFIQARDSVMELMSMGCLRNFIRSKYFTDYRLQRIRGASETSTSCSSTSFMSFADANTLNNMDGLFSQIEEPMETSCWLADLKTASISLPVSVCICDMQASDQAICFINPEFTRVTGYSLEESVGRNCRFLQGKDTEPEAVRHMQGAVELNHSIRVQITNYKKDGTEFINLLTMKPVWDRYNQVRYYVAVQFDLSSQSVNRNVVHELLWTDPVISLLPDRIA